MPQLWKKLCAALASPKRRKAFAKKYTLITLGSLLAAAGLQLFLVPNSVIDGGVVGLSIMFGEIFQIPFNLLLVALNLPFVILAAVKIGLKSAVAGCIATLLLLMVWASVSLSVRAVLRTVRMLSLCSR